MQILYLLAAITKPSTLPTADANEATLKTVLQAVFLILGTVALLIVTIAGFKYVVSQGDPGAVEKAKNTILYAIIGLVVALSAWAIVTFVLAEVLK